MSPDYAPKRAEAAPRFTAEALDSSRTFQGLTVKMEAYCQARFAGANVIEAYAAAYNPPNSKRTTMQVDAAALERDPRIVQRIQQLTAMRDAAAALGSKDLLANLSKEWVLSRTMHLAEHASTDAVKLRALELLGKTVGIDLFREVVVTERRERNSEDVDKELRERLAQLKHAVLDLTAKHVDETEQPPVSGRLELTATARPVPRADRRRKPGRPPA